MNGGKRTLAIPVRMCVICRERFEKAALARYIINTQGMLVPDLERRMPGRGFYCCSNPVCQTRFASYKPGKKRG